jgi:hypothetical protein
MDSIDTLVAARVGKPSGIATGEASIWNGTGWDRSSVTKLNASNLAPGSNGQVLTTAAGVSTWGSPTVYGTTLPGSPADGVEAVLVDSLTNPSYAWRFRYNTGSALRDKWEFIGGAPGYASIETAETTASAVYGVVATAGPTFTLPRIGIYLVSVGYTGSATVAATLFMSYTMGASIGTGTVTIASPAVFTKTAHGLIVGDPIYFTTTGALPTGLIASTVYYVISAGLTADNFEVSTVPGGAAVNTSGTQSGTHTFLRGYPITDQDATLSTNPASSSVVWERLKNTEANIMVLTSFYKTSAGTATFGKRWLRVTPIRVS